MVRKEYLCLVCEVRTEDKYIINHHLHTTGHPYETLNDMSAYGPSGDGLGNSEAYATEIQDDEEARSVAAVQHYNPPGYMKNCIVLLGKKRFAETDPTAKAQIFKIEVFLAKDGPAQQVVRTIISSFTSAPAFPFSWQDEAACDELVDAIMFHYAMAMGGAEGQA